MEIINTLTPILLMLLFGVALARHGFLDGRFLKDLNRLAYYVGLPALIVESLATTDFQGKLAMPVFAALALATLASIVIGLGIAWLMRYPAKQYGTFLQAAFRGNLAYIGIPLLVYIFSDHPEYTPSDALPIALLVLAPMMILYNVAAVTALLASQHRLSWLGLKHTGVQIIRNPLILASIAGSLLSFAPWSIPISIARSLETIGQMAVPIALLCIGGSLTQTILSERFSPALAAALIKVVAVPAFAYALGRGLGLSPLGFKILMVFAACPTAVASYIMAAEMHGDEGLASGAIVLSTLLAIIPLAVVVGVL